MANNSFSARNLSKIDLGGVIFGCTHVTMKECFAKQLFGLPGQHMSYVQNIEPGLPLFLFNYSDRKLYGIFEAESRGQFNLDPYGWSADGSEHTKYPAQVRVRTRMQCEPLLEKQFKPIIADNYHTPSRFCFELDGGQAQNLIKLFGSSPVIDGSAKWIPKVATITDAAPQANDLTQSTSEVDLSFLDHQSNMKPWVSSDAPCINEQNKLRKTLTDRDESEDEHIVYRKLQKLALERSHMTSFAMDHVTHIDVPCSNGEQSVDVDGYAPETLLGAVNMNAEMSTSDLQSAIVQLTQGMNELKAFSQEQHQKTSFMEKKMAESKLEIGQLKDRVQFLELQLKPSTECADGMLENRFGGPYSTGDELIYILGGHDGSSSLSTLDCYSPSTHVLRSLRSMSTIRSYAAAAVLNGHVYVFGGGNGAMWYDTVESYNPLHGEWTFCPSLSSGKGNIAGATLQGKLFAIGGGNKDYSLSDVEMFDPSFGRWVHIRSMLQKRFAPASAVLHGALYAVGGYDGINYLKSAERIDPRSTSREYIPDMKTRRGCHSLIAFNEKLYALGGYDGNSMVSSVEVLDPRFGSWTDSTPMNLPRGYAGAVVYGDSIYVMGGVRPGSIIADTVECYKDESGWLTHSTAIAKRYGFSAVVL